MRRGIKRFICLMAVAAMLCSGVEYNAFAAPARSVKSVAIKVGNKNYAKKTYQMEVGKKITVKAVGKPAAAVKSISYYSSQKSVASVTKKGEVKAKKAGQAKITATVKGKNNKSKKVYMKVKVVNADSTGQALVSSVTLSPASLSMAVGESAQLKANVRPAGQGNREALFSSSNPAVAAVSAAGLVRAVASGTAKITVSVGGKSAHCMVAVREIPAERIKLNMEAVTLNKGQSAELVPTVLPGNATEKKVTYSSSDQGIVSVDSQGLMTAVANGTAEITVRCGRIAAVCRVTVVTEVTEVRLKADSVRLYPNDKAVLEVIVYPEDASNTEVFFTSSQEEVASVSMSGEVTAHKPGLAVITARTQNGGFEASCTVEVRQQTSKFEITPLEGDAVYLEEKNAYEMYVGDTQEFEARSDIGAEVSFESSDESVLEIEEIEGGKVRVISKKNGIASMTVSSVGDKSNVTDLVLFYVNIDRILVSQPTPIRKTGEHIYELTVSLMKGSGNAVLEEELTGSSFGLRSEEYLFDAEYVEGSYDSQNGTAVFRVGNVGHVILDSGTGALTYRIASFDGNLADGSEEGQELLTSYAELVEGIHLLPFDESGETQAKELYVGQDFLLEARPVNENATVKAFRFTVENQQPAEEGGEVASIALLDGNKVEVSALGAGTAEILVSATDGSGMEKRLTVTVRQDTILADPKTIGRVVKHVSANGSFSFTVSMSVSLESQNEVSTSEDSSLLAARIILRKEGDEGREVLLRCEKCEAASDPHLATLTFRTEIYEAGKDESSAVAPCPLVTRNNAATGLYHLVSPSLALIRFVGYPDENGEKYPKTSYRETATSQSIEGYVVNKIGARLPGMQIRVGNNYNATTDSDGYYFIDLGTSRVSDVVASDPTGTYWDASYSGKMDVSAGKKVAVNFVMEEQKSEEIYLYGYVKGRENGAVSALGGATVKLQRKEGDSEWATIAETISSDEPEIKGRYVFENSEANVDGYSGEGALPPYIHRFEAGDIYCLSNDAACSYRVVAEKPVTSENLSDVYKEATGTQKALNARQASTSLGDILLEKTPETYTDVNINNGKEFRYQISWDNEKYMEAGSAGNLKAQPDIVNKTAATNVTGNASGIGMARYRLFFIAPDGITVLKEEEFSDSLVDTSEGGVKRSQMETARDLTASGFFGANSAKPTLTEGIYYFVVDDGINAYTIVPVNVNSDGAAAIDNSRCVVTIPFIQEIHTQTFIEAGSVSMKKLEASQSSGSKLTRVLDRKGTPVQTKQIESVVYDVFQMEGDVRVYLRSSRDEASNQNGMTVQKDTSGVSALHSMRLGRLQQGKQYCMQLTGDMILGMLDQQTGAFVKKDEILFIRADATGTAIFDCRVKGTANINCVELPLSAFDQIVDSSICVESVTLKKGNALIGTYEVEEEGQPIAAEGGCFRIEIPDTAEEFKCLEEGNDYSIKVEVSGYATNYEEAFGLIQYGEKTVVYQYDEETDKDSGIPCYSMIGEKRISGTLTDTEGNAVVDDKADTIDAIIYLYDANKRLCGIARMGCGDVNGDTKAFQFVDGINASIEGDGNYTLLARCSMCGSDKGTKFQVTKKEIAVTDGRCEGVSVNVTAGNKPGATISAVILQENPIGMNGEYGSNASVLPSGAKAYAYERSAYYIASPLDCPTEEMMEGRFADGMRELYEGLVRDLGRNLAGIGRYEMRQNENDRIYWETDAEVAIGHYAIFAQTKMMVISQDAQTELREVSKTFLGDNDALGYFVVLDSIGRYSYAFEIALETNQIEFMREITVSYSFDDELERNGSYDMVVLYDANTQLPIAYYCDKGETDLAGEGNSRKVTFKVYNNDAKYRAVVYRNGYYVKEDTFSYSYQQTTNDPTGNIKLSLERCM